MPTERVQRRIDRLLDQAEEAADQRVWDVVRESAEMVLSIDPQNADATTFLTMVEASHGQTAGEAGVVAEEPAVSQANVSPTTDTPTSFANGRYEVTGFLGEGGKKKVYLAHDTTLDRDVAFALIKIEGLDDASRQRVTREAQAMGRLGDHPNIMPIHDLGDENGQPYMVQPLMGGGDVEALIEDAEDGRLSLEDALRITSETCRGLEFAHSKGIIHRDLKPGNVWLTDDGTARIGDFGLALSLDRSRLTQEKMMVGTVSYMPPEQATGGEITPRADLYSLGAMLYEMVTGRPPFMGDDEIAIIGQHINTPPVAPSWHNPSLPQTLDSLIMRLLAKDPAERPESAAEVLQALDAIDPAEATAVHEDEQGSLDSMSGGVFVGRHREMDQLKATFEDTLGGHGKVVALVGEPGIGKTRTAQELATYASMRGGQVLWGRCYEGGGAPPHWPWVQAIRSYVMDRDAETVRREMGSTASVISEIVPDVKERLPDLQPPPRIEDPESARFRLFDSITTFLKTASSTQPIVLMLEDLHWADKPSLMLLEFVARELSNSRLMIVGNYRDVELNRRHPLSVTLGELTRERLFDRVLLRGLQKHDVRRFIEVAAGIDPPDSLVEVVYTQTEGNPLFVTETVRLLIQEGDIASGMKSEDATSSWDIRIPEGVREVIGRRLDRLSESCNEVLTTAAVIGRQFRFGVLMKLVEDVSENMLLDVLDEALAARIVEEVPSEVGLYQFAHAQMQETLTSELSANRVVRFHAQVAEALEEFWGNEAEGHAAELVEHFAEAETVLGTEKLVKYSLAAANQALLASAAENALFYSEKGLAADGSIPSNNDAAELWFANCRALAALGGEGLDSAGEPFQNAFEYFFERRDYRRALELAGHRFAATTPDFSRHRAGVLRKALELTTPDTLEYAQLAGQYGYMLHSGGRAGEDLAEFEDYINTSAEIARRFKDISLEQNILAQYSTTLWQDSRLRESAEVAAAVLDLVAQKPDSAAEWRAQISLGWAAYCTGDLESALEHVDRAKQLSLDSKNLRMQEVAWWVQQNILVARGDWDGAISEYDDFNISRDVGFGIEVTREVKYWMTETSSNPEKDLQRFADIKYATNLAAPVLLGPLRDSQTKYLSVIYKGAEIPGEIRGRYTSSGYNVWTFGNTLLDAAKMICTGNTQPDSSVVSYLEKCEVRYWNLSVDRVLAGLALTAADVLRAIDHFEAALQLCRRGGYRVERAWTCSEYSEMLLDRNAPGDREKATELQDEAIAIAQELGMRPLLERVLAQREILKA